MSEGKNWNDLPPELKRKCIGEMDFKDRTLLRSTSKGDRVMVDSVKQTAEHLIFTFAPKLTKFSVYTLIPKEKYGRNVPFSAGEEGNERETDLSLEVEKFDKVLQFLKQILECSEINRFEIRIESEKKDNQDVKKLLEMLESVPIIRSSKFLFDWQPDSSVQLAILKKCDTKLKDITIHSLHHADVEKLEDFFNIPSVICAEKINVSHHDPTEEIAKMKVIMVLFSMHRWVVGDERIGKQISVDKIPLSVLQVFESEFPERVSLKNEENGAIRFRMDDVEKYVWVRISPRDNYLQCFIVAATSADPDFKKMDKERIDDPMASLFKFDLAVMMEHMNAMVEAMGRAEPEDDDDYDDYFDHFM